MAEHDGERLGTGNLTLKDVVAQSVGYMGPVFSGTFFIPTIVGLGFAGKGAGIASPFAILLTAIGMLAPGVDHLALRQADPRRGRALRLRQRGLRPPRPASSPAGSTTAAR